MLCIAAKSGRYGFVLLGGKPPSTEDLARLVGAPVEEVAAMIEELECRGIFSRDRNGTIYCRRMVRDERERPAKIKAGKIGGRVTHEKQKGIFKLTGTALSKRSEYRVRIKNQKVRKRALTRLSCQALFSHIGGQPQIGKPISRG